MSNSFDITYIPLNNGIYYGNLLNEYKMVSATTMNIPFIHNFSIDYKMLSATTIHIPAFDNFPKDYTFVSAIKMNIPVFEKDYKIVSAVTLNYPAFEKELEAMNNFLKQNEHTIRSTIAKYIEGNGTTYRIFTD